MNSAHQVSFRNNSGNKPKEVLLSEFVVRLQEFDDIISEATIAVNKDEPINYLVVGQRGYGKTTLLHRVKYAFEEHTVFSNVMPVMLSEEQYSICSLADFWEKLVEYCTDWHGWADVATVIEDLGNGHIDEGQYRKVIFERLKRDNARIFLFLENFDVFIRKIGEERELFHQIVSSSPEINILASSTSLGDQNLDLTSSEFSYLNRIVLKGLSTKECIKLLLKIGENTGNESEIKNILKLHKSRVESLRRLTGGVPRTISYMFDIFLDNKGGRAIKDLYQLVDTLTLLYKAEIDQLSPQQQKVIDVIAKNWDAVAVKDIARLTRLESKNISSILSTLERNSLVVKINTKTKNNLYRIRERFLNIWYLMRFGRRAEKENVKWLVRFFDIWCDEPELTKRISEHIAELQLGDYDVTAAIDMGNTFLSCRKVPERLKFLLYKETKNILPERLSKSVRISKNVLYNQVDELINTNRLADAKEVLDSVDHKDGRYYILASRIFIELGQYQDAVNAIKMLDDLDAQKKYADVILGVIYETYLKDGENAKLHFRNAHSQGHPLAAWRLGYISYYLDNDLKAAERYLRTAIKKIKSSYETLFNIYMDEGDLKSAKRVALEASNSGIKGANIWLGKVFTELQEFDQAEDAYVKAIDSGEIDAAVHLAKLILAHAKNPDFSRITDFLQEAIDKGFAEAYQFLGHVQEKYLKDEAKAEQTWLDGVKNGDPGSAHRLAHFYQKRKEFVLGDKMYKNAIEMGDRVAFLCYADDLYRNGRKDMLTEVLNEFEEFLDLDERFGKMGHLLLSKLLLWNNEVDRSVSLFQSTYPSILSVIHRKESDEREELLSEISGSISNYLILLLAKSEYQVCYQLFEDQSQGIDLKSIAKPVYYVLMEKLKREFPIEYLKAGPELSDTISEINEIITNLKKNI